ncbi:M56 family metallopeptidase [Flavobacterium gawalongense]|uniref:M56 family metallopeptidase n=1 Tax=Flavobacterium gawalongense TaxID=2594432 RepID=UPI001F3FB166|nr:M56 family metallopeptidase [Flavobacterium gawalongense]
MILYILKSSLLLFILITVYKLLLENEKMHHFNRIYLLGSLIFSLTIPLQLFSFKTKISDTITHFQLNEILLQKTSENLSTITDNQMMNYTAVTLYLLVALLLIIRFVLNLYSFYKKIKNNEQQTLNGNKVVLIQEPVVPHSFLNSIFFYEQDFKNNNIAPELIVHEAVHIKQKHTLDILFIEVLQILFWFNPLILLYKHAIKLNHEFLADETVNAKFNSVFYYQKMLLNIASNQRKIALASSINYLITKKRLIMMTKKESKTRIILKTVGVGVIFSLLLFSFSPETMAQESPNIISSEGKIITEISQPEFPGGMLAFYKFVGSNFKTPSGLKGNGKVYITFMIEKDGSLSEFEILRDMGFGTGEEAIRV